MKTLSRSQIFFPPSYLFFFLFRSKCRKCFFFVLQTENPATSSSRRKLQLIFISAAVKFRELRESKSIEGEADCKSFSKHSTHIPAATETAWRRHRIAKRNYFLVRRANRSLGELLLHLYRYLFLASERATGTRLPRYKCRGISNVTRGDRNFSRYCSSSLRRPRYPAVIF